MEKRKEPQRDEGQLRGREEEVYRSGTKKVEAIKIDWFRGELREQVQGQKGDLE